MISHNGTRDDTYRSLITKCRELIQRNWHCEIQHVIHEANSCVDVMALKFCHLGKG